MAEGKVDAGEEEGDGGGRSSARRERERERKREIAKGPQSHFLIIYAPPCGSIVRSRRINRGESPPPFAASPIAALRLQLREWSN